MGGVQIGKMKFTSDAVEVMGSAGDRRGFHGLKESKEAILGQIIEAFNKVKNKTTSSNTKEELFKSLEVLARGLHVRLEIDILEDAKKENSNRPRKKMIAHVAKRDSSVKEDAQHVDEMKCLLDKVRNESVGLVVQCAAIERFANLSKLMEEHYMTVNQGKDGGIGLNGSLDRPNNDELVVNKQ